jgi:glycosyltransferase involved in cell wall biosynthesis
MSDFTVAVCTFGDPSWRELAESRAVPSTYGQAPVIRVHGETLHDTRNEALEQVRTRFVVYLDADDELEPGYIQAMETGTADMRVPSVRYVTDLQKTRAPMLLKVWGPTHRRHDCTADCLPDGNFMVIGTAVRTDLLREAGGWRDFPWSEDWDAWLRCWHAGATIETIPTAVYRAHVRPDSRNRGATRQLREDTHWAIHRANFPHLYEQAA